MLVCVLATGGGQTIGVGVITHATVGNLLPTRSVVIEAGVYSKH